jgi:hypothetical protein
MRPHRLVRTTVVVAFAAFCFLTLRPNVQASLYGPWLRYASRDLGFQTLCVSDWRVIPVQNGVVFVMQSHPKPYVRMAVGRISAGHQPFDVTVQSLMKADGRSGALTPCTVAGKPALAVEGPSKDGYSRDYYVNHGSAWYWISFNSASADLWPQYSKSFDLILNDFQFL